jgi:hypothetical protein
VAAIAVAFMAAGCEFGAHRNVTRVKKCGWHAPEQTPEDEQVMKRVALVVVACSSLALTGRACAWNDLGHMTVAAVAWQNLSPAARTKVAALLRKNPSYPQWIHGVPAAKRAEYAFMHAATWPDDIKKDDLRYTDEGDTPSGPRAARNVGYVDVLRHRYWHYINFSFSPDGTAVTAADPVNIETQIRAFRQTLRSPTASEPLKSYDLVWLIHFVGDAHQPLHSTSRFTAALPAGDRGGGSVTVCPVACATKKQSLHAFWDDALGDDAPASPAAAQAIAKSLPAADPAQASIADEHQWLEESLALAKTQVYVEPIQDGAGPFTLSGTYQENAKQIARRRIALAGARLAKLIEASL